MMRRLLLWLGLILSPLSAFAQGGNTTITGQVLDPNGNKYTNSGVSISFYDPGTSSKLPLINGSVFQKSYTGYATDSFGNLPPISLPDNGAIATSSGATGTQWVFSICYSDRQTCFRAPITINCSANQPAVCAGNTINITVALQSAPSAPLPSSVLDNIYIRKDGGNNPIPGGLAFTGNNTHSGAETFTGGLTLPASSNGALKPASADAVRYVSSAGNDGNDGLSWGTAKLTVYGALISLPGGSASPATAGAGTVYFSDGASSNPTAGAGVWLMAGTDPNYASPPAGWLRSTQGVALIGVMTKNYGSITHIPKAALAAGSGADSNHPAVWLSGTQVPIYIANASFAYPKRGVLVGECSNNTRTGTCAVSDVTFDNLSVNTCNGCGAGTGPSFDITGGSFWLWFRDIIAQGTSVQNGNSSNLSPAFLFDGTGNTGIGFIQLRDIQTSGGIKLIPGTNGFGDTRIENYTMEGDFASAFPPAIWYAGTSCGGNTANHFYSNINVADVIATTYAVENDCAYGGFMTVVGANGTSATTSVLGPAIILGGASSTVTNQTFSPRKTLHMGVEGGRVFGQVDAARRGFSPSIARFANIAPQNNNSWTASNTGGGVTFTHNTTGPDGVANAALATTSTGGNEEIIYYRANRTYAVGDFIIAGLWARRPASSGVLQILSLQIVTAGFTTTTGTGTGVLNVAPPWVGDGEWEWYYTIQKITAIPGGGVGDTAFNTFFRNISSVEVYAPIFLHIPTGTVSDNEAYELAANLSSYPDTAVAGDVAMLRGQRLNLMGNAITGIGASGTTLTRYARYAVTLSPAAVGANTCAAQSFTVTGLAAGDILIAVSKPTEQAGLSALPGHVSAANTATVNFCNHTAGSITPTASESYNFVAVQ